MRVSRDLGQLSWTLEGWRQWDWQQLRALESGSIRPPEVGPVPASVPGSVRAALLNAGIVPDPMVATQSRASEWIENRHWVFSTVIPDDLLAGTPPGSRLILRCIGLDYAGTVLLGDAVVGHFKGSHTPHEFDVTEAWDAGARRLDLVFTEVPDNLGQIGHTSRIRAWKPRFNYGWDWTPRIVQIGIPAGIEINVEHAAVLRSVAVSTRYTVEDGLGRVDVDVECHGLGGAERLVVHVEGPDDESRVAVPVTLKPDHRVRHTLELPGARSWNIAGRGDQARYHCSVRLIDSTGRILDEMIRPIGFRSLRWAGCEGAPPDAEPWVCVVNDEPLFLQGVNWAPIRPDFADVTDDQYRDRLETYRNMGVNLVRVWGGAGLEREVFYDLCDELGLLVWQDLPLSSSGLDNRPPDDDIFAGELAAVAESFAERIRHHPSLALWCGGNEIAGEPGAQLPGAPLDTGHQALGAAARALDRADPQRRFVPASPSGPSYVADPRAFGAGQHHDVHGPWAHDDSWQAWTEYWDGDDALMRSEVGIAGASPPDVLEAFGLAPRGAAQGELRRLWAHSSGWWLREFDDRDPTGSLEQWVADSQARQAELLAYAARSAKSRFPRCGGFVVWMGHDTFPCAISLSLLDVRGRPKPAAHALREVFMSPPGPN